MEFSGVVSAGPRLQRHAQVIDDASLFRPRKLNVVEAIMWL